MKLEVLFMYLKTIEIYEDNSQILSSFERTKGSLST